jgi:hypothetical protein
MPSFRVFTSDDALVVREIFAAAHQDFDESYAQMFAKQQLRVDLNDISA